MPKSHVKPIAAAELDAKFDAGEDVLDYFDLSTAKVILPAKSASAKPARRRVSDQRRIRRALEIAAEIEKLGSELSSILGVRRAKQRHTARHA